METTEAYDASVWKQMGEQLGLQGLALPEAYGGSGLLYVELGIVLEEMGRALLCAPFFSTVRPRRQPAAGLRDDRRQVQLPPRHRLRRDHRDRRLHRGQRPLGRGRHHRPRHQRGRLEGLRREDVRELDGHTANLLWSAAKTAKGTSILAVDAAAAGVTREALPTMDQTRKQAKVTFAAAPAELVGEEGKGWSYLSKMLDLAAVALSAEQVGGAQRCRDVGSSTPRTASSSASHRLVPGHQAQVRRHAARDRVGQVRQLLRLVGGRRGQRRAARRRLPRQGLLLGGVLPRLGREHPDPRRIGFTWEHDAHLYFKRAKSSSSSRRPDLPPRAAGQRIGI